VRRATITVGHDGADVLEPALTKWDKRVLAALDEWSEHHDYSRPLDWRTVWNVAERLREYDVVLVRRTLDGLERLGYVMANGWDHRRAYVGTPWKRQRHLRALELSSGTEAN